MPPRGYLVNLGEKRGNTKPRKVQSHLLPPENPPPTDPVLANAETLVDVSYRPMFSEIYERGRGNITAFASDFLNVSLEKNGKRHNGMEEWWHTSVFANERHLSSGNRWGKALQNDEPILTPTGWKPIGKAQVNDWVYSQDGTPTQIIGVYPQGIVHCYKLTFDDGSEIITSDDHLWQVRTSRERFRKDYGRKNGHRKPNEQYGKWTTLTTKQILEKWGANPRPKQRVSIPVVDPIRFAHQDLPIDPYVFGLWLGDGGMSGATISFTTKDPELLESVNEELIENYEFAKSTSNPLTFLLRTPEGEKTNVYVDTLHQFSLMGKRSWEKHIPYEYLFNDVESRIALLQGLMDTDGTIQADCANVEYSTTSEKLAEGVLFLVESLGGKGKIASRYTHFTNKGVKKQGRKSYRIDFRIPGICPFRLKRKADRWKEKSYTKERILVRIEDAGHQEATCIEVDHPSSLFVAKDFIVTHNSFASAIKVLHHAFYQTRPPEHAALTNEYRILILSLTIDMAKIIWEYAMRLAIDSPLFSPFVVQSEIKTAPFPSLIIGSPKTSRDGFRTEIAARSSAKDARYILGRKYDYIVYDECARDPHGDKILDEVIRMRLADRNGRIDMVSTAAGKNWFWKAFQRGLQDTQRGNTHFYSKTGSTLENPFIDHDRVMQNEQIMARQWVEQNIYGGFADFLNVFDRVQIERMYEEVHYELCTDFNDLEKLTIDRDAKYLMGIDWALKRDETVIIVARVDEEGKYIRGERDKSKEGNFKIEYLQGFSVKPSGSRYGWDELKNITVGIHKRFNNARCLFDSTGLAGEMIYQDLAQLGMTDHEGYDFGGSGQAKDHLIVVAQQALQNSLFKFPMTPVSAQLADQLLLYDRDDKGLPTDYVIAFCLLCENLRRANLPESQLLSLPFYFGFGGRRLGGNSIDQPYSISLPGSTPRPNPFTDGIIITSGGYKKEGA